MASFYYAPLDRATRSIRLLRLEEQSTELELVCCSLETHRLDHCPPYAALSYVWGEEGGGGESAKGILVDGKPFLARRNLHSALCAIREFEDRDRLWVKTSTALSDFTSHQTNLPDLMRTLKSYTPKHRWQAVIRKVLATDCIMIRNPDHRYNHVDRQFAHWDIFQSIMGCHEQTWNGGDTTSRAEGWSHRYYWIDAICIDQENDLERGHQVNMMGDIYGGAACVITWLGPSSAGLSQVMPAATGQSCLHEKSGGELSPQALCDHPYWDRLWTAQEYILAQDVLLVCDRREVALGEVQALANVKGRGENSMSWRMEARNRWRLSKTIPLDMLLERLAAAPCSDPRDRVYGLLSLLGTQSESKHHLQPDYTISGKQLYYRVLGRRLLSASKRTTCRRLSMAERRAILRLALKVADDDDFKVNDLLYQVVECAQEQALELNSDLIDDPRMASHREVLRGMSDPCLAPRKWNQGGQDPQAVYSEVTNIFSVFPKGEDPLTWETFGKLLRQELGLESVV